MVSKTLLLAIAGSVPVMTDPVNTHLYGPSPLPSNHSGTTTIHGVPSTEDTITVQSTTMVSGHPIFSATTTTPPSYSSASTISWLNDISLSPSLNSCTAPTASSSSSSSSPSISSPTTDARPTPSSGTSLSSAPGSTPLEAQSMASSFTPNAGPSSSLGAIDQTQTKDQNATPMSPSEAVCDRGPASWHTQLATPVPPSGHTSPTSTITHPPTTQTSQPSSPGFTSTRIPPTGTNSSSSSIDQPTASPIEPRGFGITILTGTRLTPGSKPTTPPVRPPDTISPPSPTSDHPGIVILTGTVLPPASKQSSISPSPSSKASETSSEALPTLSLAPPSPAATAIPEGNIHHDLTAVIDVFGHEAEKEKERLAVGLGIGLGAGIPAAGLVQWLSTAFHALSTVADNGNFYRAVMDDLTQFRMDEVRHFNLDPKPPGTGSLASEVAKSVDEWYDELYRNGNTGEQAAEIINHFNADLNAAEAAMADQAVDVESVIQEATGRTFSNPNVLNSWGVQAAAQVASTPGTSAEEITNSLLKAGVPTDVISTVSHAISQALQGSTGRPAYNVALGIIASSVTSAGMAAAEAAKAAVGGATGSDLAGSLGPAGVPAAVADATAEAMTEAIQAAKASGSEPTIAAINVISKVASPAGLAVAAAMDGDSGSSLAPALSAAGVPTEALGATADAVSAEIAIRYGGESEFSALSAALDIIDSASVPRYERMSNPAPAVSPAQAALDVVGASFNFWHVVPWLVWDTLTKLKDNTMDLTEEERLDSLLAIGTPPDFTTSFSFRAFPYRRGGNRITGLSSLQTRASRPIPSSTHQGTQNGTQSDNGTPCSTPPLKPAPPGTGGYLIDGTEGCGNAVQ